jgi:hypothetical protein
METKKIGWKMDEEVNSEGHLRGDEAGTRLRLLTSE